MGVNDGSGIPAWVGEQEAPIIFRWLVKRTGAKSIIDLGTGLGHLVKAGRDAGFLCMGVEGNAAMAASAVCDSGLIVDDVTRPGFDPGRFDLATSFECVEHIPLVLQEDFFSGAAKASNRLICSIHHEGEENEAHMTLRSPEWWEAWFTERGISVKRVLDFPIPRFTAWGSAIFDLNLRGYEPLP